MSGEFERIAAIRRLTAGRGRGVVFGIGDDAALLTPRPGFDTAVSSDLLVESIHFRLDWSTPEQLGHKALAVSLSDMAAMGASPTAALLSLGLPAFADDEFVEAFYRGATAIADRHGTTIVGGDLSASPTCLVIDSVLIGHVEENRALRRDGARHGQDVWVSGTLGTAAAGLSVLESSNPRDVEPTPEEAVLILAHRFPEPRINLGRALVVRHLASAAIDVSDGLSSDLRHVCDASAVGIVLESDTLPAPVGLEYALHGGEQYELIFTADEVNRDAITALAIELSLALTRIGRVDGSLTGLWMEAEGQSTPLEPSGHDHFRSS